MCWGFCLYPTSSAAVLRLMATTLTGMKHMRSSWAAYMNHRFCSSSSPAVIPAACIVRFTCLLWNCPSWTFQPESRSSRLAGVCKL